METRIIDHGVLEMIMIVVGHQADDEGLWFNAQTAPEAYLQQELRHLHSVIETALSFIVRQSSE
jgi:hypothetical protein